MSRTSKDDKKRGPLAYGKGHKQRAVGYEYWGSRSGKKHGEEPGNVTKRATHRAERRQGKKQTKDQE